MKIHVVAGEGGNGAVSFERGPHKRVAPPDGGDGGYGGSSLFFCFVNF